MKNQLEIHHVSVSGGDATIIAFTKDLETNKSTKPPDLLVLIDAGNSVADTANLETYRGSRFGKKEFDYVILSHNHADHRGGLEGFNLKSKEITLVKGHNVEYSSIEAHKYINVFNKYSSCAVLDLNVNKSGYDLNSMFRMVNVCTGGIPAADKYTYNGFDSEYKDNKEIMNAFFENESIANKVRDDNDHSLAWVLQFNDFYYFTAGDLSGADVGRYKNVEGRLLELFKDKSFEFYGKKMNVMKASHHGSRNSSFGKSNKNPKKDGTSDFLDLLAPEKMLIPCNNRIPLPHTEFLERCDSNKRIQEIYFVNFFSRPKATKLKKHLLIEDEWMSKIKNIQVRNVKYGEKDSYDFYVNHDKPNDDDPISLPVFCVVKKDKDTKDDLIQLAIDLDKDSGDSIKLKKMKSLPPNIAVSYFDDVLGNSEYVLKNEKGECYLYYLLRLMGMKSELCDNLIGSYGDDPKGLFDYGYFLTDEMDLEACIKFNDLNSEFGIMLNDYNGYYIKENNFPKKYDELYTKVKDKVEENKKSLKGRQKKTKRKNEVLAEIKKKPRKKK
jgi:beta-lactamase superfamily II metal-dependent hydrolase